MDRNKVVTNIFYSYAHEDQHLCQRLMVHLSSLRRDGLIADWVDRDILPGQDWANEINENINKADIILLLISADFIYSDYCYGKEMKRALERQAAGEAIVIPIILRPTDWSHSPFSFLQALPSQGKPITSWSDRDSALLDVTQGIRKVIQHRMR
jgi:hypothetical protein